MNDHIAGPLTYAEPTDCHACIRAGSEYVVGMGHASDEERAALKLFAASFNAFDKAGRALGVDAAELAQAVDVAALIRAAVRLTDGVFAIDCRPVNLVHVEEVARLLMPLHALLAPMRAAEAKTLGE